MGNEFIDNQGFSAYDNIQVLQSNATATGNGNLMHVRGLEAALIKVTGITSATIVIQGIDANGNVSTLTVTNTATGVQAQSITVDGLYSVEFLGLYSIQAQISVYGSGTINIIGSRADISVGGNGGDGGGLSTNDGTFAQESGGNLATLAGKDFATQTTLALIKSKTDNIPSDPAKESGKLTDINTALGTKADAASTATDTTSTSAISIFKQISKVLQDVWDSANHLLGIGLLQKLDKVNDQITTYPVKQSVVSLSASGSVLSAPGQITGIIVNATSSGILQFEDALTDTTPTVGPQIALAAYTVGVWYPLPLGFNIGIFMKLVSGTGTVGITYIPD